MTRGSQRSEREVGKCYGLCVRACVHGRARALYNRFTEAGVCRGIREERKLKTEEKSNRNARLILRGEKIQKPI